MKHAISLLVFALVAASVVLSGARGELPPIATVPILLCLLICIVAELHDLVRRP